MEVKTIKLDKDQFGVFMSRIKFHLEKFVCESHADVCCFYVLRTLLVKSAKKLLDNQAHYNVALKEDQLAAIAWMLTHYDLVEINPYEFTVWQLFYENIVNFGMIKTTTNAKS